jgi:hypothetical protein
MEKQVHSKEEKTKEFRSRYSNITLFLVKPVFGENFSILKKFGFINGYISDPNVSDIIQFDENKKHLFLLFKNKKLNGNELERIIKNLFKIPVKTIHSYELVNDYSMVVVTFPREYNQDYQNVLDGKYSSLSLNFKENFPDTQEVKNSDNVVVGEEYTLYHHVFNKTTWLKEFWMERLGLCKLSDQMELWEQPTEKECVFNIKSFV